MPFMRNRADGALPIHSLHQMLGHEGGSNKPLPVERLDKAFGKSGGKTKGGKGISIGNGVGDTRTEVLIPQARPSKSNMRRPNPYKKKGDK